MIEENKKRLFERRWNPHSISRDPASVWHFGFTLHDLRGAEDGRLQAWADRLEALGAVGDLYLAAVGDGVRFSELRFQMVTQALEAYHREIYGGELLPEVEWQPVLAQLQATIGLGRDIPKPLRVIRNKLKQLNSVVLAVRLTELFAAVETTAEKIAGEDPETFSQRVANTRNRLTHPNSTAADDIPRDERLLHATERLLGLLEILLLRDLGFAAKSKAWEEVLRRRVSWLPA